MQVDPIIKQGSSLGWGSYHGFSFRLRLTSFWFGEDESFWGDVLVAVDGPELHLIELANVLQSWKSVLGKGGRGVCARIGLKVDKVNLAFELFSVDVVAYG